MIDGSGDVSGPPVIVTKVRPPRRRRDVVRRNRLIEYISDNVDRKLLLVSAPAGYGKTALLVDFAEASRFPICWYRLDADDRDPAVFFSHLLGSLRQLYPAFGRRTAAALRRGGQLDVEALTGSLVNEIDEQIEEFFLLVLDDYHAVDSSISVNRAVDRLLQYLPGNSHIVIASRTLPTKLTLTRLVGEGQVAGVGQEQLRFTTPEVRALVSHQHNRDLSEMEGERLAQESEGWAAALVMGSERILGGVGFSTPSVDRDQLFQFLALEVFDNQPADVRRFLMESAVLDALSPALCDYVLSRDDSADMLQWLDEHHVFITPIAGEDAWYRYHQLFQEFLLARLHAVDPVRAPTLHQNAAAWYGDAGRTRQAIHHLLAAERYTEASELMETAVGKAHAAGQWATIIAWCDELPHEVLERHPRLLRMLGTAYTYNGKMTESISAFASSVAGYESAGDDEGLAAVLVSRSLAWRQLGQLDDAVADSRRALALTAEPDGLTAALAYRSLGGALALRGDMQAAADQLNRALVGFEAHGITSSTALVHTDLSYTYQMSGDIELAIQHAIEAKERWEELGNIGSLAMTLNNLGTAYHQQGRFREAQTWLAEAVRTAREAGVKGTEARALISMADVLTDLDDFTSAVANYERGLATARAIPEYSLVCYGLAASADARRLAGDLADARGLAAQAREVLSGHLSAHEAALVDFVRGAIALDSREFKHASEHLEDAARAFGKLGARREEARSMLYRCAVAQRAGSAAEASAWRARAESAMVAFGYSESFEPYLRRLPEVFPTVGRRLPTTRRVRSIDVPVPEPAPEPEDPRLQVLALGPPEVLVDGVAVERKAWQTLMARDIFLWLADRPGGVSRDELMAAFWPESDETRARSNLHSTLYRVRRAVGDKGIIQSDFERYFVPRSDDLYYDVAEFEELLDRAERSPHGEERAAILSAAVRLVRSAPLDGVPGEWCVDRRRALELRVTDALHALGESQERLGRDVEAIAAYRRAVEWDALREDAHRGLMRVYAATGERARALRQFEDFERLLGSTYGATPAAETTKLYQRIRDEAKPRAS